MSPFNAIGRCTPATGARVFGEVPSQYYVIDPKDIPLSTVLARAKASGLTDPAFSLEAFTGRVDALRQIVQADAHYSHLLNGVCVPFVYQNLHPVNDLGAHLESVLLPGLRRSFTERFPDSHFKAVLQGNATLAGQLTLAGDCGYDAFMQACSAKPVVGLYFPQALQEYSIPSQRDQLRVLPALGGAQRCLSGGMDICAALTGHPELLISEKHYAPILCLSAYVHRDPRLTLMLKSYGPHMEFWCMTQMLTPTLVQVSEQWSGGITVF